MRQRVIRYTTCCEVTAVIPLDSGSNDDAESIMDVALTLIDEAISASSIYTTGAGGVEIAVSVDGLTPSDVHDEEVRLRRTVTRATQ